MGGKSRKTFICDFDGCTATFARSDKLNKHKNLHANLRPYVCSYDNCGKSYISTSHLKRHTETHQSSHKCSYENCHFIFKSVAYLNKHVNTVHLKVKPKTYKCSLCDAQFNKHAWLKQHEYNHTGIKPYVCMHEGCEKRFEFPTKLRKHMKVHEGYPCQKPDCDEHFSKWSLYRKHLKVCHPISHKCEFCEKTFSRLHNMRAHLVSHNSDSEVFPCPEPNCCKFYFAKRNLTYHMNSYHEKRPFVCQFKDCSKAFLSEAMLIKHSDCHDLNKPLKKKKKHKQKPSFAEKLAGLIPKNQSQDKNCDSVSISIQEKSQDHESKDKNSNTQETSVIEEILTFNDAIGINDCKAATKTKYVSFGEFIKVI